MGPEAIVALFSLVFTIVMVCAGLFTTVLSVVVPVAVIVLVIRRIASGQATVVVGGPRVVVRSPILNALAASTSTPAAPGVDDRGEYVKRCTCPACGAANATPSKNAYLYCEYCGEMMDFDFQAAIADKRSKLPGPAYEAIVRRHQGALNAAKAAGDTARYEQLQAEIFDAYCEHCPAALSPRIGDPRYRASFVAYSAKSATLTAFDPKTSAATARQQAAVSALVWDRSRGQARVTSDSFWRLFDEVLQVQESTNELIERHDLLAEHPDRPSRDVMRRIALSLMLQGWMPYLERRDSEKLLDETGLRGEYVHVPPPSSSRQGSCPSCSTQLEVVEGAKRVVCHACGHMVGVDSGELRCHGCATPMVVPEQGNVFHCPSCDVELKRMRWPG